MPLVKATPVTAKDLKGFKYFQLLGDLFDRLHDDAIDKSGNRKLFFDQFASMLLLYFFNPILTSLNGLQQATHLEKVQEVLGCRATSIGSLSESSRVFDPTLLEGIIAELVERVAPVSP